MQRILALVKLVIETVPMFILDPTYLLVFLIVFIMVYSQYKKIGAMEIRMFGLKRSSALKETFISLAYGLIGGMIATVLFIALGITLPGTGVILLWLVAILLALLHPRFLCFSYSAGIISLLNIIFGIPEFDIPSIMGLVAILHLVEAILIYLNGAKNPSPIYLKHETTGKIVGGFSLHRFWPVPFMAVIATIGFQSSLNGAVTMPDWWPLLAPEIAVKPEYVLLFTIWPVMAGLGYSDLALSSLPHQKANQTAFRLALYSICLLGLSILANRFSQLLIVPAIFAPVVHEFIIYQGLRRESKLEPLFTNSEGVMILDVYPNSPADQMGLKTGDLILSINGVDVSSPQDLSKEMDPWLIDPVLEVKNLLHDEEKRVINYRGKLPPLGIIPVPNEKQRVYIVLRDGYLVAWLKKWLHKRKE